MHIFSGNRSSNLFLFHVSTDLNKHWTTDGRHVSSDGKYYDEWSTLNALQNAGCKRYLKYDISWLKRIQWIYEVVRWKPNTKTTTRTYVSTASINDFCDDVIETHHDTNRPTLIRAKRSLHKTTSDVRVMPISHRRHEQVLCSQCRWFELNWRQDKTVFSSPQYIWDWTVANTKLGRDKTKLSCLVVISVHTGKTRQDHDTRGSNDIHVTAVNNNYGRRSITHKASTVWTKLPAACPCRRCEIGMLSTCYQ